MKTNFSLSSMVILSAFIYAGIAFAGDKEMMVVELKTNDFEMAETDISNLAIGESETVVTESGKIIDLMRTAEGVEIYVDGELLDMPHMDGMATDGSGHHNIHKRVVIECEVDDAGDVAAECGENMVFLADGDIDIEALYDDGEAHKVIMKKVHSECASDEEGECEDHNVWVSDGEDFDFAELHEASEGHRVIKIHRSHSDGDVDVEQEVEKFIVIEKD